MTFSSSITCKHNYSRTVTVPPAFDTRELYLQALINYILLAQNSFLPVPKMYNVISFSTAVMWIFSNIFLPVQKVNSRINTVARLQKSSNPCPKSFNLCPCHTLSVVHCGSCLFSTVQLLTMMRKCSNLTDCHYLRLFTRTHHSQLKYHLVPFIV